MNYKKSIIIVATIVLGWNCLLLAQPEWFWQNPQPQGNHLNDVFVFNANAAVAVGAAGTVLSTFDGGNHWEIQHFVAGIARALNAVHFIDDNTGWIAGDRVILRTVDGGSNWELLPVNTASELQTIYFTNSDTGWAAGTNGIILKTTDGGATWDSLLTNQWYWWKTMYFLDRQTGWVAGTNWDFGEILKTTDGGMSWAPVLVDTLFPITSIHFSSPDTGWAATTLCWGDCIGRIYKTTNGGTTWDVKLSDSEGLTSIYFTDNDTGWAAGGQIFKTVDGGESWQDDTPSAQGFNAAKFDAFHNGWSVGNFGTIYHSTDNGSTWNAQSALTTDDDIQSVYFRDDLNGWAASGDQSWYWEGIIYAYRILKTTDGGVNWNTVLYGSIEDDDRYLRSIIMLDNGTGWAVGNGSRVFHTIDDGNSWTDLSTSFPGEWAEVQFVNPDTGWIAGSGILKTVDGGISWNSVTSLVVNAIYFTDPNTGWAVGPGGTIWKSTTGGNSWNSQPSGVTQSLNAVYFSDTPKGWAVGENGTILRTDNGGETWDALTTTPFNSWTDIYFSDPVNGWITGGGTILSTTDGGVSWQAQSAGTNALLNSVFFTDTTTGWVVGNDGVILSTRDPLSPIHEQNSTPTGIPESILLHQNYPNPFNPTTTIEFSLPRSSFVTLRIFTLLGQEVAALVAGKLPAGNHQFSWDGGSQASGIYFYRLQTEQGMAQTKRMLLLK